MSDLPEGWSEQPLADVAFLKTGPFGSALKKSDYVHAGIPVVNPMHIADGAIYPSPQMTISDATAQRLSEFLLAEGDVVMGRRGEMGRCAVVTAKEDGWLCGSGSFIVRPKKAIDPRYLQRFLSSPEVVETLTRSSVGSTMVNLNQQIMKSLSVPLPPLAEQQRIADTLDRLLARVDGCRARLGRVPALLKRFRQAVLAAAVAGRLCTDNQEAEDTPILPLSQVTSFLKTGPFGSALHKSDYILNGIPVVNPMHINEGRILPSDEMTVSRMKANELTEFKLKQGDVVLGRRGAMGRCAVVGEVEVGWLCGSGSMFMRPSAKVLPEYLQMFLSSPMIVEALEYGAVGSTMPNLNQGILLGLTIRTPTLTEQHEIVRRVETLFAYADRLDARLAAAQARVAQLTPSLLGKAFRGELGTTTTDGESNG